MSAMAINGWQYQYSGNAMAGQLALWRNQP